MNNDKRRHSRSRLITEVGYRQENNRSFGGCVARDISESGIRIQTGELLSSGTFIELQFKLPPSPKFFVVRGKVVWTQQLPHNEQWEAGVDLSMDKEYVSAIRQYVSSNKS